MSQIISQNITSPINQLLSQSIISGDKRKQSLSQTQQQIDKGGDQQQVHNEQIRDINVDLNGQQRVSKIIEVKSQLKVVSDDLLDNQYDNDRSKNIVSEQVVVNGYNVSRQGMSQIKVQKQKQRQRQNLIITTNKTLSSQIINKLSHNNHTTFNNISNSQLQQLIQAIVDILSHIVEQQQIGTSLLQQQQQSISKLLTPKTLATIRQISSGQYQSFLLQTKHKYNQLVDQSTNLFSKSRQIADYVNQFLFSINLFFESQQVLVPAQQIHKSISQLNPNRTQKYINYLIRIFQCNFDQVIQNKTKIIKSSLQNQLRKSQKDINRLQQQVKQLKQLMKSKQCLYIQNENKFQQKTILIATLKRQIQQMNNKNSTLNNMNKQSRQDYSSQLMLLKRQVQRSRKQCQQNVEKCNKLQRVIQKRDRVIKSKQQQILRLQLAVKQVKQTQDEGVNKIIQQIEYKQRVFNSKMQQFSIQKINLQGRIRVLVVDNQGLRGEIKQLVGRCEQYCREIAGLREQIKGLKEQIRMVNKVDDQSKKNNNTNKDKQSKQHQEQDQGQEEQHYNQQNNQHQHKQKHQHHNNNNQQQQYEHQHNNNQLDLNKLVNKQIMAHLFLSFQDQSKQWAIRNNIKNQIYILLDIKHHQLSTKPILNNQQSKHKTVHKQQRQQQQKQQLKNNTKVHQPSIIGKWLGW